MENIRQYAKLMAECGLDELELKEKGVEIRLSMKAGHAVQVSQPVLVSNDAAKKEEAAVSSAEYITSPLVGTFYRSSSPEGTPFITEGSKI